MVKDNQESIPPESQESSKPSKKIKTLIVEDNKTNIDLMMIYLRGLGISADSAKNGEEAVSCADDLYDLIFMDCQMPVMDGFQATLEIRKKKLEKEPVIVALTANILDDFKEKCLSVGMDEFLSKQIGRAHV